MREEWTGLLGGCGRRRRPTDGRARNDGLSHNRRKTLASSRADRLELSPRPRHPKTVASAWGERLSGFTGRRILFFSSLHSKQIKKGHPQIKNKLDDDGRAAFYRRWACAPNCVRLLLLLLLLSTSPLPSLLASNDAHPVHRKHCTPASRLQTAAAGLVAADSRRAKQKWRDVLCWRLAGPFAWTGGASPPGGG